MKLRIDGRVHEVDSRVGEGVLTLTVDGVTHNVPWRRDPDGVIVFAIGGRSWRADAEGALVVVDGRSRRVERVATAAAEVLPDRVVPPMPSVVVRVMAQVGDVVVRGAPLVVVSAMKTETTLKAPKAGVVTEVRVVVGQSVKMGEELVVVG